MTKPKWFARKRNSS